MEYVKLGLGLLLTTSSLTMLARMVRLNDLPDPWTPLGFYSAIFAIGGVLIKSAL